MSVRPQSVLVSVGVCRAGYFEPYTRALGNPNVATPVQSDNSLGLHVGFVPVDVSPDCNYYVNLLRPRPR